MIWMNGPFSDKSKFRFKSKQANNGMTDEETAVFLAKQTLINIMVQVSLAISRG